MATYTAPTTRTTGALISASIWNTDIVENLKYFKDAPVFDGAVKVTGALTPNTNDGSALGSATVSWADLFLASGGVINFNNGDVTVTHSSNTLTFAGAASGYIFNDGNVGIGVTPTSILHLRGSAPTLRLDDSGNTTTTISYRPQAASYDERGAVSWNVDTGEMRISAGASGNSFFQTFYLNGTEAMRVNAGQELLIGYTADNGAYKLQVNSQIFATNATIATSDGRFKTDVQPVREGLAAVKALQPVQFKWKKHPVHNFIDGTDVGFIAQDVRTALTGRDYTGAVVTQNGSGESEFLGMADSKLIPLLVAAVQELSAEVNALKAH